MLNGLWLSLPLLLIIEKMSEINIIVDDVKYHQHS